MPRVWGEMDPGFISWESESESESGRLVRGAGAGAEAGSARSMVGGSGVLLSMISRGFGSMWDVDTEAR